MKITFATEAEAQTFADKVHAQMIATNSDYAKSVADGGTKRWAVPLRELDDRDQPVGDWYITVKDRCLSTLTTAEKAAIKASARDRGVDSASPHDKSPGA